MDVENHPDAAVSRIAAAIGEPARARMLYSLLDGHARTSTELATVAGVTPSTASAHLNRLKAERLVKVLVQGKHRYYNLEGRNVASALEGLSVLAGGFSAKFVPNTPNRLRAARTCYEIPMEKAVSNTVQFTITRVLAPARRPAGAMTLSRFWPAQRRTQQRAEQYFISILLAGNIESLISPRIWLRS